MQIKYTFRQHEEWRCNINDSGSCDNYRRVRRAFAVVPLQVDSFSVTNK
jgi:hypothetical protein